MSNEQQRVWEKIAMAIAISAVGWLFWTTSQNSIAIARGEERDEATRELIAAVSELTKTVFEMKGVFSALDFTNTDE
jgi:hypothetical protein